MEIFLPLFPILIMPVLALITIFLVANSSNLLSIMGIMYILAIYILFARCIYNLSFKHSLITAYIKISTYHRATFSFTVILVLFLIMEKCCLFLCYLRS